MEDEFKKIESWESIGIYPRSVNFRCNCPICTPDRARNSKCFSIKDKTGICFRCGIKYVVADNFNSNDFRPKYYKPYKPKPKPRINYFVKSDLLATAVNFHKNNFTVWLRRRFGDEATINAINTYCIGSIDYWNGATVFWQIDIQNRIRTGKVMLYNSFNGKRVKTINGGSAINWMHSIKEVANTSQCLFGEHLLSLNQNKKVAIVESEKTAIIMSLVRPQEIWLACGGLSMLSADRCKPLQGRKVTLYPDLNGFDKWKAKADELGFKCSSFLQSIANKIQVKQGLDIADFILNENTTIDNVGAYAISSNNTKAPVYVDNVENVASTNYIFFYSQKIADLTKYFSSVSIPDVELELMNGEVTTDLKGFIDSQVKALKVEFDLNQFNQLAKIKEFVDLCYQYPNMLNKHK